MKKYQSIEQIKTVLDTKQLPELWDKAQRAFEKKSGWNRKQIQATLKSFSELNGVNKVFFGGLLVGQALLPQRRGASAAAAGRAKAARGRKRAQTASQVGA